MPNHRVAYPREPAMLGRRKLLHVAPHHLDKENLAEPRQHIRVAGTLAKRLLDGMPQRRLQPVAGLDRQRRRRQRARARSCYRRLSLATIVVGMYHHNVWQCAEEWVESLVAVEIAADKLRHLADVSTHNLCNAVRGHRR